MFSYPQFPSPGPTVMPRALADSRKGEVPPFVWWIIGGILDGGKGKPPLVVGVSCVNSRPNLTTHVRVMFTTHVHVMFTTHVHVMFTTQVHYVLTTWRVWRLIRVTIGAECQRARLGCRLRPPFCGCVADSSRLEL